MPTELWVCDFGCGFMDESKSSVERHEEMCDLNSDNQGQEAEVEADDDPEDTKDILKRSELHQIKNWLGI